MDDLTPKQLDERATELRACARRARTLAESLGSYLDAPVTSARQDDPTIWCGPYAESTVGRLTQHRGTLRNMAGSLTTDALRWEREAERMDDAAAEGN